MAETIQELKAIIALYERPGETSLFYALNRKMNEMAAMLNKQSLSTLDLADGKDKTFERLKIVWNDAASIATAARALGDIAGITNDEEKDTQTPKYRITSPESIANVLGNTAGQTS